MGAPRISIAQVDRIAAMMTPQDRASMGIQLPAEKAEKQAKQAEKELQRDCENLLRLRGIEYLHMSNRAREKEGWPDLVFALRSVFCGVELKKSDGIVSNAQERCLERLKANGARVCVCRTVEEFRAFLDAG
jgi:hypothetical protein